MLQRVLDLTHALRDAGIPVGISEADDAVRALEHVDLADRRSFRAALAASIVKSEAHRPTFDTLFELYFGAGSDHVSRTSSAKPLAICMGPAWSKRY